MPLIMSTSARCELDSETKECIIKLVNLNLVSIGRGEYGRVYKFEKYPEYAVKHHGIFFGCEDDKEYDISRRLLGVKHENLMQVVDVINEKISVYKFIKGDVLRYESCKIHMSLKHFLEKWCIGLIEAMRIFSENTGTQLDDIHDQNIMVTWIGPEKNKLPIPILIDFSRCHKIKDEYKGYFCENFIDIAFILYSMMKSGRVIVPNENTIYYNVKEYLENLKYPKKYHKIDEVINDFKNFLSKLPE